MAADDLDSAIKRSHAAVSAIFGGNPEPAKTLFSDEDDITLGNPFGPFAREGLSKVQGRSRMGGRRDDDPAANDICVRSL
jgi:hypothetical protein